MLKIHSDNIADKEKLIARLDYQIDEAVKQYQVEITLLQTIDGIAKNSAITIISEIGVDMSKFPNEHHLSSWAGMSPEIMNLLVKKKCKNNTWQYSPSKHLGRKCLGCNSEKGWFFETKIRKSCRKTR
jgi:hypothetical protein